VNLVIHRYTQQDLRFLKAATVHALEVTGGLHHRRTLHWNKGYGLGRCVCPVDCIHLAKSGTYDDGRPTFDEVPQLYIDPSECIDCGACVPVCPVTAIFALDDLPEKWRAYIATNKNYVDGREFQLDKYQIAYS